MTDKLDYKKSFFERELNENKKPISAMSKLMQKFGYFYEYENGRYYVYTSQEWRVKKEFDATVKPLFIQLLENQ